MISQSHLWGKHNLGGWQEDATDFLASMTAKYTSKAANDLVKQPGVKDAISGVAAITVSAAVQTVKEEAVKTVVPALVIGFAIGYLLAKRK